MASRDLLLLPFLREIYHLYGPCRSTMPLIHFKAFWLLIAMSPIPCSLQSLSLVQKTSKHADSLIWIKILAKHCKMIGAKFSVSIELRNQSLQTAYHLSRNSNIPTTENSQHEVTLFLLARLNLMIGSLTIYLQHYQILQLQTKFQTHLQWSVSRFTVERRSIRKHFLSSYRMDAAPIRWKRKLTLMP